MIDQDAAHDRRDRAEEVGAVLPVRMLLPCEPEVGFVHERRGLQRVAGPFARQVARGERPQLVVHHGHHTVERRSIPAVPRLEQFGQRARTNAVALRHASALRLLWNLSLCPANEHVNGSDDPFLAAMRHVG